MNSLVNVCVLIASYNGERYIEDQILSVLNQKGVKINLLVRDDGSTDSTVDILKKYEERNELRILPSSGNVGTARSFFELLKNASDNAQYFAFCDQDDIWDEDKIVRAVTCLASQQSNLPCMYFSRQTVVDDSLNIIGYSSVPRKIGFGNALVECITPGCTVVIDNLARDFLIANLPARFYMMHDWWVYLTLTCFGKVIYDPIPSMKYRQHANNVVGLNVSFFRTLVVRWKRYRASGNLMGFAAEPSQQAIAFEKLFDERMPPEHKELLNKFVRGKTSFILRLKLAFSPLIWRQKRVDDFLVRLLIVMNRY
jgi:glycosyltransferase involved in cell wall biosynthesis